MFNKTENNPSLSPNKERLGPIIPGYKQNHRASNQSEEKNEGGVGERKIEQFKHVESALFP
jgi:hypothetical protein